VIGVQWSAHRLAELPAGFDNLLLALVERATDGQLAFTVLDVGANIGQYSVLAGSRVGSGGRAVWSESTQRAAYFGRVR
jgi:hypothetical protein